MYPFKKGFHESFEHIAKNMMPNKYLSPYSSLFKIKPIWAFAIQPLVLAMPGNKKPTLRAGDTQKDGLK